MINSLSGRIAERLVSSNSGSEENYELYVYGLFILLSNLMYLMFVCIFGIIFRVLFESVVFYTAFRFIRKYAGGYHSSTETRCEIMSLLSIAACVALIRFSKDCSCQNILLAAAIFSAFLIFFFCPLDTPEKPLTEKEHRRCKRISVLILLIIFSLIIISYKLGFSVVFAPCCVSLLLEAVLLIAGKIKLKIKQ